MTDAEAKALAASKRTGEGGPTATPDPNAAPHAAIPTTEDGTVPEFLSNMGGKTSARAAAPAPSPTPIGSMMDPHLTEACVSTATESLQPVSGTTPQPCVK